MVENLRSSNTVTALSVLGFVFGLLAMLISFLPLIGSIAFFLGIPASLICFISLLIARSKKARTTFAVVALTVSLIGVGVSAFQYYSIKAVGESAKKELQKMTTQPPPKMNPDNNDVIPAKVYSPTSEPKSSDQK